MRIAYLTEWSPYDETGVLKKLIGQVSAWRALGAEAQLFALCPLRDAVPACSYEDFGSIIGRIHEDKIKAYPAARLGFVNKIISTPEAKRQLSAFAPDVIYYRQHGPWYPGLASLLKLAPVVMEINTREEMDARLWGLAFQMADTGTKKLVHSHAAAFICMTDEIAEPYLLSGKPVGVIPNAMNNFPPRVLPPSGNASPALVITATPLGIAECWHGVDKLFDLAAALPHFLIHVVGYSRSHYEPRPIPENLIFHGYLGGAALAELYARCDVGFGSLAAHRKSLRQACPLKTREYLSYGLPVIVGYEEAEERLRNTDFVLEIPNHENNIRDSVDQIRQFAEAWLGRRVVEDLSAMSLDSKERQRLEFLEKLLQSGSAADEQGVRGTPGA
jgi:hypothetical protein